LNLPSKLVLYISSVSQGFNSVTISYNIKDNPEVTEYSISNNDVLEVIIPPSLELTSGDEVQKKAIHIKSSEDIAVYAVSSNKYTADAYISFPVQSLGKSYIISSWKNLMNGRNSKFSSAVITALHDSTIIKVHP